MNLHPVILAGGKGTRLGRLTSNAQKCILETENPLYTHFDKLIEQGFEDVTIAVCFKADDVINLLGRKYKSLNIYYSKEKENLPLGTVSSQENCITNNIQTSFNN